MPKDPKVISNRGHPISNSLTLLQTSSLYTKQKSIKITTSCSCHPTERLSLTVLYQIFLPCFTLNHIKSNNHSKQKKRHTHTQPKEKHQVPIFKVTCGRKTLLFIYIKDNIRVQTTCGKHMENVIWFYPFCIFYVLSP